MVEVNWIELDGLPTFDREPRVDGGKYAKAHGASSFPYAKDAAIYSSLAYGSGGFRSRQSSHEHV
jgi:hypothetical protein